MKTDKQKKLILALCLVALAALLFVPGLLNYDLGYKNEKTPPSLPEPVSDRVVKTEHDLPVIYLYSYEFEKLYPRWEWTADGPVMPPREESLVDVYVFDNGTNFMTDSPTHVYYNVVMRLRGRTSSYLQSKKPFKMEFCTREGEAVNLPFLTLGPDSDFVFHAPQIDRSLIRNWLGYSIQRQLLRWAPDSVFAEVYLDRPGSGLEKGDYIGVYLITEKIKKGVSRINIGEFTKGDIPASGNYIYKMDAYEEGFDNALLLPENKYGNRYSLVYPADGVQDGDAEFISGQINFFEDALYRGTDRELARYYDLERFARCILTDEFLKNYEGFSSSTYFYRPKGERVQPVQWDFDIGTGNADFERDFANAAGFFTLEKDAVIPFLKHENFRRELLKQWRYMRQTVISDENIEKMLDEVEALIRNASQRNDEAYPEQIDRPGFTVRPNRLEDSARERRYIRQFLLKRAAWLDENLPDFLDSYNG